MSQANYAEAVLASSPLSYYDMQGDAVSILVDAGSLGANLTQSGSPTLQVDAALSGTDALCAYLSGNGQWFKSATHWSANFHAFSMEWWFKADTSFERNTIRWDAPFITTGFNSDQTMEVIFQNEAVLGATATSFAFDTWYQCVLTSAGGGTDAVFYVNGAHDTTWSGATATASANAFWVGAGNDSNDAPLKGYVMNYSTYNEALSADDVAAHYAAMFAAPSGGGGGGAQDYSSVVAAIYPP